MKWSDPTSDRIRKFLAFGSTVFFGALASLATKWPMAPEPASRRSSCYLPLITLPEAPKTTLAFPRLSPVLGLVSETTTAPLEALYSSPEKPELIKPLLRAKEEQIWRQLLFQLKQSREGGPSPALLHILIRMEAMASQPQPVDAQLENRILDAVGADLVATLFPNAQKPIDTEYQNASCHLLKIILETARKRSEIPQR